MLRPRLSLADKGNRKEEGLRTVGLKSVLHHMQVMLLMLPEGLCFGRWITCDLSGPTAG